MRQYHETFFQGSFVKRYLLTGAILLLGWGVSYGESGAQFLRIDSDAKTVSMGSAYAALSEGVGAVVYNPAGLASLKGLELGFTHTNWLMDSSHDFVGVAMPVRAGSITGWRAGMGITRLSNGAMEERSESGNVGGKFSSYDQAVSLAFAKALGQSRFGFGVKYVESVIDGTSANAFAVDFGVSRSMPILPISVGVSVQNLGTSLKYMDQKDSLPLTFSAGMLVGILPGFNMALDVKRLVHDNQTNIGLGTEYTIFSGVSLRAGYLTNNSVAAVKGTGASFGTGFVFWGAQLDYAVSPYDGMGNTQRFTLKKRF